MSAYAVVDPDVGCCFCRYGCDGLQQENRTMFYFEYPSLAAMLLREVRYGVELSLDAVEIRPFGAPAAFEFHTGNVNVRFDPAAVSTMSVPGSGLFPYSLHAMVPGASYDVSVAEGCSSSSSAPLSWAPVQVEASMEGVVRFTAPRGTDCMVSVRKM